MTDLGTLGLTGSGFEVAAPDVDGLGGIRRHDRRRARRSRPGDPVEQVGPETSLQYEGSVALPPHALARRAVTAFVNNIDGNIQKQALILPQGAVGTTLGGAADHLAERQRRRVRAARRPSRSWFAPTSIDARVWGIEHNGYFTLAEPLTLHTVFTYLRAEDLDHRSAAEHRGRHAGARGCTCSRAGSVRSRAGGSSPTCTSPGSRRTCRRSISAIAAPARAAPRASIQSFFRNGAPRSRLGHAPGLTARSGTRTTCCSATGETLAQVQDRVLGVGRQLVVALHGGPRLHDGRHPLRRASRASQLIVHAENLTDANYRGISWGVDAPGRGLSARYAVTF